MIQKRVLVTGTTARTARYLSLYCSVQGLRIYGVKISKMPSADLTLGRGPDRDNAQRPAQRDPGGDGLRERSSSSTWVAEANAVPVLSAPAASSSAIWPYAA